MRKIDTLKFVEANKAVLPPVLYHGTSVFAWRRVVPDGTLYLVNDVDEAWTYAYETAAHDEENGLQFRSKKAQVL